MAVEDILASSEFYFFSFLSDILCQVPTLSFVSLHFPLQDPWEEFSLGNHSVKLAKSELNSNTFLCTSTFFFFFCDNQKDNSLGKVTITLHWGRIYSQYKNCTFYLVYSGVFLMVVPQLPLLGEYSIV